MVQQARAAVATLIFATMTSAKSAEAPPRAAAAISMSQAATTCVAAPGSRDDWQALDPSDRCQVVRFERIAGTVPAVFFQMQAYLQPGQRPATATTTFVSGDEFSVGGTDNDGAGIALLEAAPDERGLVPMQGWSGRDAVITDLPHQIRTQAGPILVLRMDAMASSHPQDDVAMRRVGSRWREMDTASWQGKVRSPRNTEQWHGPAMDWPTLRAYGTFSRKTDFECCSTGGSYVAQLYVDGTVLRVRSIRYSRTDLAFP